MTAAIVARSLTCVYGGRVKALDSVGMEVPAGSIYGLVGPNGSGKTTLVRILCGLQKPTGGSAMVLGHDVDVDFLKIRCTVGYMSQRFSLYLDLSTRENLDFFAGLCGLIGKERKRRIDEVVAATTLEPYLDRPAAALSGGWKQRLALASALLHRPPLMFLDEPTAGIDPVARRDLWDLLFDLASNGTTIFVTTQYMDEVERCSEVGYIYLSRLIATGTPRQLKSHPAVKAAGTRHVDIECDRTVIALRWLREQPFCRSATVFGHSIHAIVDDTLDDPQIQRIFDEAQFGGARVLSIEPTLEDVFVALTQDAARARAAEARK